MRFVHDVVPQYDLTYSDVFMVPSLSDVASRLDVDLTTPDGLGTTIPVVVANMTAVAGRRMAETVARRGGLTVLPQDIPLDVISENLRYQKSRHPIYETAITLGPTETVGAALNLIHKRAHGVLVVVDDERRPIGIFAERDAAGLRPVHPAPERDDAATSSSSTRAPASRRSSSCWASTGSARPRWSTATDGSWAWSRAAGALRSTIYRPAVNARGELMSAVAVGISGNSGRTRGRPRGDGRRRRRRRHRARAPGQDAARHRGRPRRRRIAADRRRQRRHARRGRAT